MSGNLRDAYQKRVLILALYAGEILLTSGAEVYRVEDTIVRICKACGVDYVECVATTTSIVLSLDRGDDEGDMHAFVKRIKYSDINLTKISKINQFSRIFTSTDLSAEDGFEQLRKINDIGQYHLLIRILCAVFVGISMVPYYGGNVFDMMTAGVCAGASYALSLAIGELRFPKFIRIFISCAVCSLLVYAFMQTGFGTDYRPIILGSVTMFMPGIAITNAARDMLSGDMIAGLARAAEAFIIAIAISGGSGIMLRVWMLSMIDAPLKAQTDWNIAYFILFGVVMSFAFSIMFRTPPKQMIFTTGIGTVGLVSLVFFKMIGFSIAPASFFGTCIVAVLAEAASRAGRDATTIFILPGIIAFVPGSNIIATMTAVFEDDLARAAELGVSCLIIAGAVAVALILVASLTRIGVAVSRKLVDKMKSYNEAKEILERGMFENREKETD